MSLPEITNAQLLDLIRDLRSRIRRLEEAAKPPRDYGPLLGV